MFLDLSPLRVSRDYRLLFFGQLVSFFGSMMTFIVVPWQMYQLTQSSAMVGYIYLAEFVPMVDPRVCRRSAGGFSRQADNAAADGDRADASPRRSCWRIRCCRIRRSGSCSSASRCTPDSRRYSGRRSNRSFKRSFPPNMMSAVMALNSIRWSVGAIVSPAVAGVIATHFGPSVAYAIDLVTFAATIYAVLRDRGRAVAGECRKAELGRDQEGVEVRVFADRNLSEHTSSTSPRCSLRCRRHCIRHWRCITARNTSDSFRRRSRPEP